VALTSFSDRERILDALDAGATGYLLKDAEPEELLRGVRAAAAASHRWTRRWRAPCSPHARSAGRRPASATASATCSRSSPAGCRTS
jgi:DNA-binding NarL/FixJ family response regulator